MRRVANKAVILARGLGRRMRAESARVELSTAQENIAASGVKALMPVAGDRTLLDLISANVKEAGFTEICLVIGPEHYAIREHCAKKGLSVSFAIQNKPLGTADAVAAAEEYVRDDELFLVLNSDNLYPAECLRRLRAAPGPALLAFERKTLIAESNIPEERIARFATVDIDEDGFLRRIVEKPEHVSSDSYVSMNAWLFDSAIFAACRAIGPSERGEYEIASAVQYATDVLGVRFEAIPVRAGVLDMSSRADIAAVTRMLK